MHYKYASNYCWNVLKSPCSCLCISPLVRASHITVTFESRMNDGTVLKRRTKKRLADLFSVSLQTCICAMTDVCCVCCCRGRGMARWVGMVMTPPGGTCTVHKIRGSVGRTGMPDNQIFSPSIKLHLIFKKLNLSLPNLEMFTGVYILRGITC